MLSLVIGHSEFSHELSSQRKVSFKDPPDSKLAQKNKEMHCIYYEA